MNIYDLMLKYSPDKSESCLWDAIRHISEYVEYMKYYDAALTEDLYKDIYRSFCGRHYNAEFGMAQLKTMSYEEKGKTVYAPYWSFDDMKESYETVKDKIPSQYTEWDFIVALNYLYTKHHELLGKWFDNAEDRAVELTVSFFNDPEEEHKIWKLLA